VLGIFNLFSGGNFAHDDFCARHHAYITSSIILQLMTVVFHTRTPAKRRRARAPQDHAVHALLTIVLSVIQSSPLLSTGGQSLGGQSLSILRTVIYLMTILRSPRSAFIMWLANRSASAASAMEVADHLHVSSWVAPRVADLYEKAATRAWGPFTPLL